MVSAGMRSTIPSVRRGHINVHDATQMGELAARWHVNIHAIYEAIGEIGSTRIDDVHRYIEAARPKNFKSSRWRR
jgi:hypothetical protein